MFSDEVTVCFSMNEILEEIKNYDEVFIIGGASIYKQFLPYANKQYLTEINASDEEADVYFSKFNKEQWIKTILSTNKDREISYKHVLYKKMIKIKEELKNE